MFLEREVMLQIGCPKAKLLSEKLNGLEYEGVHFKVESAVGLTIKVSHDAASDSEAKALVKKILKEVPELVNVYTNIQMIDEKGRIL